MKKAFAIAYNKYEKQRNGKYKTVLIHESFYGTFDELEDYCNDNNYTLVGWDC